ncbi:hypothetical protein Ahy_A01g001310 isoform A [Arachis hypogaea]|uniref:Uncharacterized protein n=1 Tax=Arachis hypogaea TaxID=3818 RepID=A0A445EMQ7_ARAHY|nr:hypothetical protein Ahy_A01g001310 isoform A [Arachis hypogaea]
MGSATSRLDGSRPPTARLNRNNTRFSLSSLLCGASTSRSTYQMEEHPSELQVDLATEPDGGTQEITEESSLSCTEARISCSHHAEAATSSNTRTESHRHIGIEGSSINVAASSQRKCLSECKELVPPHQWLVVYLKSLMRQCIHGVRALRRMDILVLGKFLLRMMH